MTEDLIAWLRACLDEDERLVLAIPQAEWEWERAGSARKVQIGDAEVCVDDVRWAAHIERHDPAAVLADIAAKRAILDLHRFPAEDYDDETGGFLHCQVCEWQLQTLADPPPSYPCPTVRLLASAYAHRPGYRDEWRP